MLSNNAEADRPSIFEYHDYRRFLREYFEYLKSVRASFSIRNLSRRSGVSPSYLSLVLSGKVSLSAKSLGKILPHLKLNPSEQSYLQELRTIGESESMEEKLETLRKIQRSRNYQKHNAKEVETYRYLTNWYNVVIREMTALPHFKADAKWIQGCLSSKVSVEKIEESLKFLKESGFVADDKRGKVWPKDQKSIKCESNVYRLAMSKFHKDMLGLAEQSIQETPSELRQLQSYTVAIPKDKFEQVRALMQDCLKQIAELSDVEGKADSVYHIGMNAFPVASSKKKTG